MAKSKSQAGEGVVSGRPFLETPDGRYIVVRGRLWRRTNPDLPGEDLRRLTRELMAARREVKYAAGDDERLTKARKAVNDAKVALGERGPVWWTDGTPDLNRRMARTTRYAEWFGRMTNEPSREHLTPRNIRPPVQPNQVEQDDA